jgi:hypothetical protein
MHARFAGATESILKTEYRKMAAKIHQQKYRSKRKPAAWEPSERDLEMYVYVQSGKTMSRAAERWGCSVANISIKCKKIDRWYFEQYVSRVREIKANHTQRLELIYRRAMDAFVDSQKDEVTQAEIDKDFGLHPGTETRTIRKGQSGNPAFLAEARAAIKEIREIWGANAPLQIEHMGEVRVAGRPIAEARSELLEKMQRITEANLNN